MVLNLDKESILTFELNKKFKKYNLSIKIKNKYLSYEVFSKIKYEDIMTIIENVENMLFCEYINVRDIELNRIRLEFDEFETKIKLVIKIFEDQEYIINLNREDVINIYNYLTNYMKTLNKVNMIDFYKKYTYVEVRYIDVHSSRRYSYISEDKSIRIGDIVYVDRAGTKCLAVVENRCDYYYEDAPYPILQTKRVLKIVTRAGKYID
ncbi:MAG: hypothetical protein ACTTGJ_03105 [Clostridium sp.]